MFNPDLILPFLVTLLFVKVAKHGIIGPANNVVDVQDENDSPWEAWEEARLWKMAHSRLVDDLPEQSRWAKIAEFVSAGEPRARTVEACRQHLAAMRAHYSDSTDSESDNNEMDDSIDLSDTNAVSKLTHSISKSVGAGAIRSKTNKKKRKRDFVMFGLKQLGLTGYLQLAQNVCLHSSTFINTSHYAESLTFWPGLDCRH